jgi:hypothetical protein
MLALQPTNGLDNYGKGDLVETPCREAFRILGFKVNEHKINDGGCDVVATSDGVKVLAETNHFVNSYYFEDDRIEKIDANLICGYEYLDYNVGYVKHADVDYRLHICVGADRNTEQHLQAKELGITVLYFPTLPTLATLVWRLSKTLGLTDDKPIQQKISIIGNNHLDNDRTSMELYYYILDKFSNTAFKIKNSSIQSKIKRKMKYSDTKIAFLKHFCLDSMFTEGLQKDDTTVINQANLSGCNSEGKTSLIDIISPSSELQNRKVELEFNPTTEYHLLTEDGEYSFSGCKVSEGYVRSLWIEFDVSMPKVTVLAVTSETLRAIAPSKVDCFTTPLIPKLKDYLVLITYKNKQQFVQTLDYELARIWAYTYAEELSGEEATKFQQRIASMGVSSPRLFLDNSLYF